LTKTTEQEMCWISNVQLS